MAPYYGGIILMSTERDSGAAEVDRELFDSVETDQFFDERVLDRRGREGAEPARRREKTEGLGQVAVVEPQKAECALDLILPEGPFEDRRHHADECRATDPPLAGSRFDRRGTQV